MAIQRSKIRAIIRESPKGIVLTALFIAAFLALLIILMVEVRTAYDIALPVGIGSDAATVPGLGELPSKQDRPVLVLNSYHIGYSWSDNEMAGIVATLRASGARIYPVIEYLDCKRHPKMEHFGRLRDLFRDKYRSIVFPVVIVTDNPALQFALQYRAELFPRAAVVFCGINGYRPSMIEGQQNITGIAELLDADGTLEAALRIHPRTRRVVVVHDHTITGLSTRKETEEQLKPFEARVAIQYLADAPLAELAALLRTIPEDSIVLALSYSLDREGHVINHERIARILSENAPVPVYGLHEERLGYGIIGGSLLGGRGQGEAAAKTALRLLQGEPASSIPVDVKSPTRMLFDHNQLARFQVSRSALPPGAVVVNRPVSFIAEHPGLAFSTLGMMVILIAGILALGTSIYQRMMAEEEQKRLQEQLIHAQKMEAVGHLAGGVAHDFNNILTAIMGYANLIQKKLPENDPSRQFSDQILKASERATRLVQSLLAFSRKQVIDLRPADLNEIVRGIERILRRVIGEDIDVAISLQGGPLTVLADAGQIEQVLLNLCTNARDAMPKGGKLTIGTGRIVVAGKARQEHQLVRPGAYGTITVSDTGFGMDEAVRRQIFEPFFTTKEVGKGTGLGLSIVYGIVQQHGGTITVSSEPGKGSIFTVYLAEVPASGAVAAPEHPGEPPRGSETILLAEDESDVRSLVALVLRNAGYCVLEAEDGDAALRVLREHRAAVRLLLTDVIMPKKNGREVYEQARADIPGLSVLFMSGYTAEIIKDRGIGEERGRFLQKPVAPDQLLWAVREALDGQPSV